ncbi:MAG: peptide-methionine (S)-S-oxide reductase MsrA [bacterium]
MSIATALRQPSAPRGSDDQMPVTNRHFVNGNPIQPPFAAPLQTAVFALGCFWGAERVFWQLPGVHATAVGYVGGETRNPTYAQVCSGASGHAEAVLVVYDPTQIAYDELLRAFWQAHDPTQGMRQGNDRGTQYRSVIFAQCEVKHDGAQSDVARGDAQSAIAQRSKDAYQTRLNQAGYGAITTEIVVPPPLFYYAEDVHQQYLAKNPGGYCGLGGTGVRCA